MFTLADYIERGILAEHTEEPHDFLSPFATSTHSHTADWLNLSLSTRLEFAIREKLNILVVGGTGSGKTTLANALLHSLSQQCPHDRIVAIEDTMELQVCVENAVLLRATIRLRIASSSVRCAVVKPISCSNLGIAATPADWLPSMLTVNQWGQGH